MSNLYFPLRRGAAASALRALALPSLALPALLLAGASSSCATVDPGYQAGFQTDESRPVVLIEDDLDDSAPIVIVEDEVDDYEDVYEVDEVDIYGTDDGPIVGAGGRVVGFSGSYSYSDNRLEETETFVARGTIDQYLTDEHVVGAYVLAQYANRDSDSDGEETYWAGLHYHYHLHLTKRTAIFAGPSIGVVTFDDQDRSDTSLTYGFSGGIRHWLTRRVALTVEPTYLWTQQDTAAGSDTRQVLVLWGLAFSL